MQAIYSCKSFKAFDTNTRIVQLQGVYFLQFQLKAWVAYSHVLRRLILCKQVINNIAWHSTK